MERGNQGDDDGGHRNTSAEIHSGSPEAADTGDGAGDPYAVALAMLAASAGLGTSAFGNAGGASGMICQHVPSFWGYQSYPPPPQMPAWSTFGLGLSSLVGAAPAPSTPVAEPEIENTGIEVGETIGWRCWRVNERGYLQSMAMDSIWLPNEPLKAEAVSAVYGSGVHSFKTMDQATNEYLGFCRPFPVVVGRVALWGEVIEWTRGYKAEFGYPHSLDYLSMPNGKLEGRREALKELNELRAMYGLDVVPLPKFSEQIPAGWRERAVQAFARMLRV